MCTGNYQRCFCCMIDHHIIEDNEDNSLDHSELIEEII